MASGLKCQQLSQKLTKSFLVLEEGVLCRYNIYRFNVSLAHMGFFCKVLLPQILSDTYKQLAAAQYSELPMLASLLVLAAFVV